MFLTVTLLLACTDQSNVTGNNSAIEKTEEERKNHATTFSQKAFSETQKMLTSYEKVRALLASDSIVGLEKHCDEIIATTKQAEFAAPDNLKPRYTVISDRAKELKKATQADMDGARQDFGYLSKVVIELLQEEPSLQKNVYLFECPMAQDYKYWIQNQQKINNPYMGSQMLECGTTASF
jgi:hypothetical protein